MSGVAHPVLGIDHLAFVVAAGLLAANRPRGWTVPLGFAIASVAGTLVHLQAVDLPWLEGWIALSVVAAGGLLSLPKSVGSTVLLAIAAIVAGILHGYAYGESVVGVEMTPTAFYLLGFGSIQVSIALASRVIGQRAIAAGPLTLRFAGCAIVGVGAACLASSLGA